MADDNPKIASTLESARLFGTCLLFVQALLVWQRSHLFALAFVISGLAIALIQIRVLSTKLTSTGVSQLTWQGRIQLRWDEVLTVTRKLRSITVTSARGSVIVPVDSFYETDAAIRYLNSRLPADLRQN